MTETDHGAALESFLQSLNHPGLSNAVLQAKSDTVLTPDGEALVVYYMEQPAHDAADNMERVLVLNAPEAHDEMQVTQEERLEDTNVTEIVVRDDDGKEQTVQLQTNLILQDSNLQLQDHNNIIIENDIQLNQNSVQEEEVESVENARNPLSKFINEGSLDQLSEIVIYREETPTPDEEICIKSLQTRERVNSSTRKSHQCDICNKLFDTVRLLRAHKKAPGPCKRMWASQKPLICIVCGKTYSRVLHYKAHVASHAEGQKKVQCTVCEMTFRLKWEMIQHRSKKHGVDAEEFEGLEDRKCENCGRQFKFRKSFLKHQMNGCNKTPFQFYQCGRCGKMYNSEKYFQKHVDKGTCFEDTAKEVHNQFDQQNQENPERSEVHVCVVNQNVEQVNENCRILEETEQGEENEAHDEEHADVGVDIEILKVIKDRLAHEEIRKQLGLEEYPEKDQVKLSEKEKQLREEQRKNLQEETMATDVEERLDPISHESFSTAAQERKQQTSEEILGDQEGNYLRCGECGQLLASPEALVQHFNSNHRERSDKPQINSQEKVTEKDKQAGANILPLTLFQCSQCDSLFHNSQDLDAHIRSHGKPYKCTDCGQFFKTKAILKNHLLRVHGLATSYQCSDCEKFFNSSTELRNHISTHTGTKPYRCQYCEFTCKTNSHLAKHERSHTGERPYSCSYCNKRFITVGVRDQHVRSHTKEKPYPCDMCEKAFVTSSLRASHRRVHTGETRYACELCQSRFVLRYQLKSHLEAHRNGQVEAGKQLCSVCSRSFLHESFDEHFRTCHGVKHWFLCRCCSRRFASKANCLFHESTHSKILTTAESEQIDSDDFEPEPDCLNCGIKFFSKTALTEHELECQGHSELFYPKQAPRPRQKEDKDYVFIENEASEISVQELLETLKSRDRNSPALSDMTCPRCKYKFKFYNAFYVHLHANICRPKLKSGHVMCQRCDRIFTSFKKFYGHKNEGECTDEVEDSDEDAIMESESNSERAIVSVQPKKSNGNPEKSNDNCEASDNPCITAGIGRKDMVCRGCKKKFLTLACYLIHLKTEHKCSDLCLAEIRIESVEQVDKEGKSGKSHVENDAQKEDEHKTHANRSEQQDEQNVEESEQNEEQIEQNFDLDLQELEDSLHETEESEVMRQNQEKLLLHHQQEDDKQQQQEVRQTIQKQLRLQIQKRQKDKFTQQNSEPEPVQESESQLSMRKIHGKAHFKGWQKLKCGSCLRTFHTAAVFQKHEKESACCRPSVSHETFPCDGCPRVFQKKSYLMTHSKTHSFSKHSVKCEVCHLGLERPTHDYLHMIAEHGRMPFRCRICSKTAVSLKLLEKHVKESHLGTEERTKSTRVSGVSRKGMRFQCGKCGETFLSPGGLMLHGQRHREGDKQPSKSKVNKVECKFCGKQMNGLGRLNVHLNTCKMKLKTSENMECPECVAEYYTSKQALAQHLESFHSAKLHDQSKTSVCPLCEKVFGNDHVLKMHFRLHGAMTSMDIEQIMNPRTSQPNLSTSKTIHEAADESLSASKTLENLGRFDMHMVTRTNRRENFQCSECEKGFAKEASMKSHIRRFHKGHATFVQNEVLPPSEIAGTTKSDDANVLVDSDCPTSDETTEVPDEGGDPVTLDEVNLQFECSECDAVFNDTVQFLAHMSKSHPILETTKAASIPKRRTSAGMEHTWYSCNACDDAFESEQALLRHEFYAHTHTCAKCAASYASRDEYENHACPESQQSSNEIVSEKNLEETSLERIEEEEGKKSEDEVKKGRGKRAKKRRMPRKDELMYEEEEEDLTPAKATRIARGMEPKQQVVLYEGQLTEQTAMSDEAVRVIPEPSVGELQHLIVYTVMDAEDART